MQISYSSFGVYSQHYSNVFSFTTNQAALASQRGFEAGMYAAKRFALDELKFCSMALVIPAAAGQFGFAVNHSGFSEYNESRISLAYGKKLGKIVDIGLQFDYNLFHISSYQNYSALNGELGIILHPGEKISVGLELSNPFGGAINKNLGEKISSIFRFGIGYDASEQVSTQIEIIKEENIPVYVNVGLQYSFAAQFFAGIGIESISAAPHGYAGWRRKNIRIDIDASYHIQLGFTPAIILIIYGRNKNQN
jgi:hypothetical protein